MLRVGSLPVLAYFLLVILLASPSRAITLTPVWSTQVDVRDEMSQRLACHADGELVLFTRFYDSVTLDNTSYISNGETDLVLITYSNTGDILWSRAFGSVDNDTPRVLVVHPTGNILIGGDAGSPYSPPSAIDLGGGPLTTDGSSAFLAMFDRQGSHLWSRMFYSPSSCQSRITGLAVDHNGDIVLTGNYFGYALTLDEGVVLTPPNDQGGAVFLAKFDEQGALIWHEQFVEDGGSVLAVPAPRVAIDPSNAIILTGEFRGTVDLGGEPLTAVPSGGVHTNKDIFVAKFSSTGQHLWSQRFGDPQPQSFSEIAVDGLGNINIAGRFGVGTGSIDFGGGPLLASNGIAFLAQLAPSGSHHWSMSFAPEGAWITPHCLRVDSLNNIFATGAYRGSLDFGESTVQSPDSDDIFLLKLSSAGSPLGIHSFGASDWGYGYGVAISPVGTISVSGTFTGVLDIGSNHFVSTPTSACFVATFSSLPACATGPPDFLGSPQFIELNHSAPHTSAYGATEYDTAAYMLGSVAVGVFLMESDGSNYNWTPEERAETLDGIYAAMDWWQMMGGPSADLSFVYEIHDSVPTTYEPIEEKLSDDHLWIVETLNNMGYPGGDPFELVRDYNNDLRDSHGTDWAFSIFVVDNSESGSYAIFVDDPDLPPNEGYAHGYFSAWVTMARDLGDAFYRQAVPAHEMGHIFYATDEYDEPTENAGYLNAFDNSGIDPCCIMNEMSLSTICAATRAQIGWRDGDGDGVFDILDTTPETTLVPYAPDPAMESQLTYFGVASVSPLPNENPFGGNDITLNVITSVEFSVDGSGWLLAEASGGSFGNPVVNYTFTTPPLSSAPHLVQVRALNSAGNFDPTPADDTVVVDTVTAAGGLPSTPRSVVLQENVPNPFNPSTRITYHLPASTSVHLQVYDLGGRSLRTLVVGQQGPGVFDVHWDGTAEDGTQVASGVYLYQLRAGDFVETKRMVLLK